MDLVGKEQMYHSLSGIVGYVLSILGWVFLLVAYSVLEYLLMDVRILFLHVIIVCYL